MDALLEVVMLLVVLGAVYGLMLWARKGESDRSANVGLYLLYGIPGVLLTVAGLALAVNSQENGWFVLALGLALSLPLVKAFRRLVAMVTPMDPSSTIDMMGLGIVLAIFALFSVARVGSSEDSGETGAVTLASQMVQVAAFVSVAYVAVGTSIYRNLGEATRRLGIRWPRWIDVGVGVGTVVVLLGVNFIANLMTFWLEPDRLTDLEQTLEEMASDFNASPLGFVVFASAGVGEEVFFRGALQPRFGLILTSALFALLHAQYDSAITIAGLFVTGMTLGLVRMRWSTTAAILAHAIYNAMAFATIAFS